MKGDFTSDAVEDIRTNTLCILDARVKRKYPRIAAGRFILDWPHRRDAVRDNYWTGYHWDFLKPRCTRRYRS